jgi:hypothetical protein
MSDKKNKCEQIEGERNEKMELSCLLARMHFIYISDNSLPAVPYPM